MQKVRRALRKSPEAAKALVDKMWERTHRRIRSGSRALEEYADRANQLAEKRRIAREPQDRREEHRRMALWHLLSHDGRQQAPEPLGISSSDLDAPWRELSPAEQLEAIATSSPGSSPGTKPWKKEGMRRAAARSSTSLCTLNTELVTIPGTTGDVGLPGAWCSLHAVHQYRTRKLGPSPLGISPSSPPQLDGSTPKGTPPQHAADAPTTPGGSLEGPSDRAQPSLEVAEETSTPSSLCFTQQMTTVKTHEAEDKPPRLDSHPIVDDPGTMGEDSSPDSLCYTQQMAAAETHEARSEENHPSSYQLALDPSTSSSRQSDEGPLDCSGTTHVSLTTSATTHASPIASGTTHVSPTVSTAHVSPMCIGFANTSSAIAHACCLPCHTSVPFARN
ncbi:hypothetical protein CYMTET_52100 [Cymbomonas tetramitiformis]|uniref:Uncharacterized protein n=1 Tax=Cymbomonas tetramitiformis TaxID=36881 RepID=A0AAE0BKV8_9CHLO|nr:hypothetical protein CYMTET_52100 [Cymbomonas tetramitiformis]